MQTAAYIRVSSDKQDVTRQKTNIEGCAARLNETIPLWFEDSEGRNSRHHAEKRKDFQRLLAAVSNGVVNKIFVDSQDRFGTKDAFEWGKFISLLREHSCELYDSTGRKLTSDDDGEVLSGVVGALASKREQREKAHRNISGKINYAKKGEYQGGYPPLGLDVVCFGPDGKEKWRSVYVAHFDRWKVYPDGKREHFTGKNATPVKDTTDTLRLRPSVEADRLETVRQIFRWYAIEDISPRKIADRLNDLGTKPVFGEAWYKHTVKAILKNPVYLGFPTWNKRAGSEFVEYLNGKLHDIRGKAKGGRRREPADFVQPDKPEFPAIIEQQTFENVQRKLAESSKANTRPREAPQTAELWLRPFLICGQCMKPMHATNGRSTRGSYPSYFCGTYNKYGANNPTGCHCHRVKHELIESIIVEYLKQTAPKVAQLMEAADGGDLESLRSLMEAANEPLQAYHGVACDLLSFIDSHAEDGELADLLREQTSVVEVYAILYERIRPHLEREIADRQAEIDRMLDEFVDLPASLRKRAIEKMQPMQAQIDAKRTELKDWREPFIRLRDQLNARQEALARAQTTIRKEGAERQKTDALRGTVDQIVCYFRHTREAKECGKNNGKSILDRVEVIPVSGDSLCFSAEAPLGRD